MFIKLDGRGSLAVVTDFDVPISGGLLVAIALLID